MLATCQLQRWWRWTTAAFRARTAHNNQKVHGQGVEALAMAHNNQIVNGRGGREMEGEIEGGDHKGNNNAMALVAMESAEKGGGSNGGRHHPLCGTMAAVNGGSGDGCGHCRWQRSLSMAAMAVFVDGDGKGGRGQGQTRARG